MGAGIYASSSVSTGNRARGGQPCARGLEAATISNAPLEAVPLVRSNASPLLRRRNNSGGAARSNTRRSPLLVSCRPTWNSVLRRAHVWLICIVCVLDLAHEGISLVCDQFDGANGAANNWCASCRWNVGDRRLALNNPAQCRQD